MVASRAKRHSDETGINCNVINAVAMGGTGDGVADDVRRTPHDEAMKNDRVAAVGHKPLSPRCRTQEAASTPHEEYPPS